jgi:chaperone required for assembly of F1-ATPase
MKRFYRDVAVAPADSGWRVQLDGRPIKTQGGRAQVVPGAPLAEALAAEWATQGAEIDPARFVLRDLADHAIDVVAPDRAAAVAALLRYAETDTLCYRAEPDEPLHARQLESWEPLLAAAETRWDIHFERVSGVIHRPQPAPTLARLEAVLGAQDDCTLAALNTLASLAASLVVGLAALAPDADAETLWATANLEEDWQAELWGQDPEAQTLRARRLATFSAALEFARLARV